MKSLSTKPAHPATLSCMQFQLSSWAGLLPLLLLLSLCAAAHAQLTYTTANGQITITGYTGSPVTVTIPSTINGLPVTTIANAAFSNKSSITSVSIPSSVTSIVNTPFYNCSNLTSITVDAANPAYSSNSSGVLFDKSQTTLIEFPGGIGGSYTIPSGVTSIGINAFWDCGKLTNVIIPSSVTNIGSAAFINMKAATSITVDPANPAYSNNSDGILFNKDQTRLIQCPAGKVGAYVIPSSVTTLGNQGFYGCDKLTSVTIPSNVKSIEFNEFDSCSGLTSLAIPSSVTSIGVGAFSTYTTALVSIIVDPANSVYSSSSDGVLFNKSKTTLIQCPVGKIGSYVIPSSVTSIGVRSFEFCKSLTSVTIPSSVTNIQSTAFRDCTNLTSVTISVNVSSIASVAFQSCSKLKSAVFNGNAPTMRSSVFSSAASGFTVYYYNSATGFTSPTWNGYASVNMGIYSPASGWLVSAGLAYNTNLQSTPNSDGVSLLTSYALNLDPTKNQSGNLPKPVVSGNQMSMAYYSLSAGVTYTVQSSTDLSIWSTTGVIISGPDANGISTATLTNPGPTRFMRLQAAY